MFWGLILRLAICLLVPFFICWVWDMSRESRNERAWIAYEEKKKRLRELV